MPGDCGRKQPARAQAACAELRLTLTDIETVELWELEHRRSKTVQIIIPVHYAFE